MNPTTPAPSFWQRAAAAASAFRRPTASVQTPARQQQRRFEGARIDRLTADFMATTAAINHELQSDLDRLRHRGRQLTNNNDYARKFRGMVEDNIIGPSGIVLQSRVEDAPGHPDRLANTAIESAWSEWAARCDITGRLSLRDLCAQLVGGLPSDGEFLVRLVKGADAGNRFNLALQVIDVDRIDTTFNGRYGHNTVIMGVEVDDYRRPQALHLFASHPNDGTRSSRQRLRIPASELLHCFKADRAEQCRGVPWMATGMISLHHLGSFMESALLAAKHGADHYGFFTTPDGQAPGIGQHEGNETIAVSQPGIYDTLPAGTTFTPHESRYPNEVFAPFAKTLLQRIATGFRVAYHSLANDLEGVSFSSIRSGTLEDRDRWSADQAWFIAVFMEPLYAAWLQMALLSGAIVMPNGSALPAAKITKFSRHEWQPRRWEWVDPRSDIEAKVKAVNAGIMSPQDIAASMGYNFDDVVKAIGDAQKLAFDNGVTLTAYLPASNQQQAQPAQGSSDK